MTGVGLYPASVKLNAGTLRPHPQTTPCGKLLTSRRSFGCSGTRCGTIGTAKPIGTAIPSADLYQLNWFDLAIMIPYFLVLVILASYGMHRYYLVYAFFKNRHNVPGPPPAITSGPRLPYSFRSTTSAM